MPRCPGQNKVVGGPILVFGLSPFWQAGFRSLRKFPSSRSADCLGQLAIDFPRPQHVQPLAPVLVPLIDVAWFPRSPRRSEDAQRKPAGRRTWHTSPNQTGVVFFWGGASANAQGAEGPPKHDSLRKITPPSWRTGTVPFFGPQMVWHRGPHLAEAQNTCTKTEPWSETWTKTCAIPPTPPPPPPAYFLSHTGAQSKSPARAKPPGRGTRALGSDFDGPGSK